MSCYIKLVLHSLLLWTTMKSITSELLEHLRKGESLFGKDGALAQMLERILNAAPEGEMDAHLTSE